MSEENPLEDLYVDESDVNKQRLRDALSGIIGIDRESGDAVTLEGFSELGQSDKVIAYLLYRRAAYELNHLKEDELGLTSGELCSATGVPEGTVRPTCNDLSLIENDQSQGGYVIRGYGISEAINQIGDE